MSNNELRAPTVNNDEQKIHSEADLHFRNTCPSLLTVGERSSLLLTVADRLPMMDKIQS